MLWVLALLLYVLLKTMAEHPLIWWVGLCAVLASTTFALYLCAAFRAIWYTSHAEQRANRMLWLYPVCFVLTVCPDIIWSVVGDPSSMLPEVMLSISLNGFFNVMAYACNSKFSARLLRDEHEHTRGTADAFEEWSGIAGLPVGFALSDELITIQGTQKSALAESEREMKAMEATRKDRFQQQHQEILVLEEHFQRQIGPLA